MRVVFSFVENLCSRLWQLPVKRNERKSAALSRFSIDRHRSRNSSDVVVASARDKQRRARDGEYQKNLVRISNFLLTQSGSTTSPPFIVPKADQTTGEMSPEMKLTEPSQRDALTPPV